MIPDGPAVDWWGLFHMAMVELHWPPSRVGRLTIPQLVCLLHEQPPSDGSDLRTQEGFLAAAARWRRELDAWRGEIGE